MDDILFLEDCEDLLESCNLYSIFSENTETVLESFNEIITEQEMMCYIYESQRFMVEQDTQIFLHLKYDVINEGVLGSIIDFIKSIITGIINLIKKFFDFIFGRGKGGSSSGNSDAEKKLEQAKKAAEEAKKELENTVDDLHRTVEEKKKKIEDIKNKNKITSEQAQKMLARCDEIENEIKNIKSSTKFTSIKVSKEASATVSNLLENSAKELQEECDKLNGMLAEVTNNPNKLISLYNRDKSEYTRNLSSIAEKVKVEADKRIEYLDKLEIEIGDEYDWESYSRDLSDELNVMKLVKGHIREVSGIIKTLKDIMNNKLEPLKRKLERLNKDEKEPALVEYYKYMIALAKSSSGLCTAIIKCTTKAERVYSVYRKNLHTSVEANKKIDSLKKEMDSLETKFFSKDSTLQLGKSIPVEQ